VFKNRSLKRILGPKREEVTESWIKLHTDLHDLLFVQYYDEQIKDDEMGM
jgi:hypothetical protein